MEIDFLGNCNPSKLDRTNAPWSRMMLGKHGKNDQCMFLSCVGHCQGHFAEMISLKAPGNYSSLFWSYNFSFLLLEMPKPPNYMISGLLDAWEPLFMDLNIPKIGKYRTL